MTALWLALLLAQTPSPYFKIQVVDAQTGRGVPLAELRTVNSLDFFTDSNGYVAFNEPGLMGRDVYFYVSSPGYSYPADQFNYRGLTLRPRAGGSATIELKRVNIAERLCRLTGQGIYRDTVLLGEKAPIQEPVLNGGVLGQDTAQTVVYHGRMLWFWGDTDRSSYPLGNFHTTGAVATVPAGQTDASHGLDFHYFTNRDGFVKAMVPKKESQPVWVFGLTLLGSDLYAYYAQMKSLGEQTESGYLRWNDTKNQFDIVQTFNAARGWRHLDGHIVESGDGYAAGNFPINVRVPADSKALLDPAAYEAFTCLDGDGHVLRDANGQPQYRWQKQLSPITADQEQKQVQSGELKPGETHFLPTDEHGDRIFPHGGSIQWNPYRHRWIMIFTRKGGKDSFLGEIYYSEAPEPTGPFRHAVKIATHGSYTFYNPVQHVFLDQDGGKTIFFEGTYTSEFSGNPVKTPMYNYNQLLYRLNLSDPQLRFAQVP